MEIKIHRVSCRVCGEIFHGATQKEANKKHKHHVDKDCKLLRCWQKFNEILGRELTKKEFYEIIGVKKKSRRRKL